MMTRSAFASLFASVALAALVLPQGAHAQGAVNVYCSVQAEWCQAIAANFEKTAGVKVNLSMRGSGETLAAIRAEAANPKADVWFGGTGDPHLAAAEEGLSVESEPPAGVQLHDWALNQWKQSNKRAVGIYAGVIGIGYNSDLLKAKKLEEPKCWSELLNPAFKGDVQMANPNSSGTAYVIIATLVQLMGEDAAFDYLKKLHGNINSYSRSGTGPIKAVARGESMLSLSFAHDAVTETNAGFPVGYQTPCEGTGYEIGSMSIIKGARNMANAKKFYDWALSADAQKLGFDVGKQLQMPSNKAAPLPPNAPDLNKIKLINYDFAKYGAAAERRRLIERWDRDVGAMAK